MNDNVQNKIEGAELEWIDLTYKVKAPKSILSFKTKTDYRVILQPFSAVIKPKSLVAIMGSSGAGKTTFLNSLSYQCEGGIRDGVVLLNGEPLTKSYFRKKCGYVRQNDVLIPNLTVFETLEFYANIILPKTISRKEKLDRIYMTVNKLGLKHCLDSKIGDDFKKGISGGEKRRVSIAIELLKNPIILFLDEPTSGLDSKTALSLTTTLAELAHIYNHTIMCTIHQPRSQIFNQFDQLILLARGTPIYFGPCLNAIDFFASKGLDCPQYENPPDFFIDMLTIDSESQETFEESSARINNLISDYTSQLEEKSSQQTKERSSSIMKEKREPRSLYERINHNIIHPLNITYHLFIRSIITMFRNHQYLTFRLCQSILICTVTVLLWWQMDTDQSSITDRISLLFLVLMANGYTEGMISAMMFPTDRLIYIRERLSGFYNVLNYYIAKQGAELIFQLTVPTFFTLVVYLCVGFQYDAVHLGNFYLIVMLMTFFLNSLGLFCGALFPAQSAVVAFPVGILASMIVSGFYVTTLNIPGWIRWTRFLSPFYYSMNGLLVDEFRGRDLYCKSYQEFTSNVTTTCSNGEDLVITTKACQYTHGDQIISLFIEDPLELYQYELIILGFVIFFRILTYFALFKPPKQL